MGAVETVSESATTAGQPDVVNDFSLIRFFLSIIFCFVNDGQNLAVF